MDTDGSNPTNLTHSAADDKDPVWSPDGQRIAFESTISDSGWEIYVMEVDGANPTNLTRQADDDWGPVWSPDGQRIAFSSNRDGDYEIYIMDVD